MAELGKFVFESCSVKKKQLLALDKEIRSGRSIIEKPLKDANLEIWRGKMGDTSYNVNRRKQEVEAIINSYNKFKSEKDGEYSTKYLKHLSDLLYKTKKINYVNERKILAKSNKGLKNKKSMSSSNSSSKSKQQINSIYVTRSPKETEAFKPINLRQSSFAMKHDHNRIIQINALNNANRIYCPLSNREDDDNSNCQIDANEVKLIEPPEDYSNDEYNYNKHIYLKIRNKWNSCYSKRNSSSNNNNNNKTYNPLLNVPHSKSFGFRPDNSTNLLQFSSNRYPAKDHFFKVLNLRKKKMQLSFMSTAHSSLWHAPKISMTTN